MAWFDLFRGKRFDQISHRMIAEMIADKDASKTILPVLVALYLDEERKKDFRNEQGTSIQRGTKPDA